MYHTHWNEVFPILEQFCKLNILMNTQFNKGSNLVKLFIDPLWET